MDNRVLLVEDDECIRLVLCLALRDEGYEVVEAGSGEEALSRLGASGVDVVVLDLMLPGVDGIEVCRRLRASGDLPIIIVSARTDEVEVRPEEELVRRDGQEVHLTRTEFGLLVELAVAGGRVVTREELLQRVWGYSYFGDTRLLDVHIRRLRRKVEQDPDNPRCVLTVRGRGYKVGTSIP